MKHYKSNAVLKDLAKDRLSGNFANAIWALVLVGMVTNLVTNTATAFVPSSGWGRSVISILLTAVASAFLGIMQTGIAYYFLNVACGMKHSSADIFYGFHVHAESSLKISIVHVALETICTLPFQILLLMFARSFEYKYLLSGSIALFIGYLIMAPFSLAISQTYYLLLDFPDSTVKEIFETSIRIMKGHKWRLFKLELSFIPLQLLCLLSFGIGNLWLNPYMRMTYTMFFLDLMNPETSNNSSEL